MAKLDERKLETARDFLLSGIYDYPDLYLAPIDQAAIQHVVAILDKISEDAETESI